jgi:hypothetical protein
MVIFLMMIVIEDSDDSDNDVDSDRVVVLILLIGSNVWTLSWPPRGTNDDGRSRW